VLGVRGRVGNQEQHAAGVRFLPAQLQGFLQALVHGFRIIPRRWPLGGQAPVELVERIGEVRTAVRLFITLVPVEYQGKALPDSGNFLATSAEMPRSSAFK